MRVTANIPICNIKPSGRLPINPTTLRLVDFMRSGGDIPPVKVHRNGSYWVLTDGRHRLTACKLLGRKTIKCKFYA